MKIEKPLMYSIDFSTLLPSKCVKIHHASWALQMNTQMRYVKIKDHSGGRTKQLLRQAQKVFQRKYCLITTSTKETPFRGCLSL